MATLGGVDAYAWSGGGTLASVGGTLAAAAVAGLAAAVVLRVPAAIPWAVVLAAGGYLLGREHRVVVDGFAPLVGAALLLAAELASWSIDHDARIREERGVVVRQAVAVGALVAASALVSFVLVGAAAVSASAGLALTAVGIAAALASVSVVFRLLRG